MAGAWLWLWLLAASASCAREAAATKWTFLGYILADNNLECASITNLQDMARGLVGAAPGSVDVLLNVDRRTGACAGTLAVDLPSTPWSTDRDLLLQPGGAWTLLADYGEVNQARTAALTAFVQRGLTMFPPSADRKYMFLIWDHGGAFQGAGMDQDCVASSSLGMADTATACGWLQLDNILAGLQAGMAPFGLGAFDILAFDACLMGNWEVAATLAPVARQLLLSEQLVPESGLDYTSLGFMATQPAPDTAAVTARWSSDYITSCTGHWDGGCTIAAITTGMGMASGSGLAQLTDGLGQLASSWVAAIGQQGSWASVLVQAGLQAQRITKDFASVVDLGDFLTQVDVVLQAQEPTDPTAAAPYEAKRTQLAAVQAALATARSTFMAADAPTLTGLSVFWPRTSSMVQQQLPFLSPLAQLRPAIQAWLNLVNTTLVAAQQLRAPYQPVMAAVAPFLPTPQWTNASTLQLTGYVPAPVLMAGDLLVGFTPDAGLDGAAVGGVLPSLVLRAIPAQVQSDHQTIKGAWDGKLFGLAQRLTDQDGTTTSAQDQDGTTTSARAPLYTEEVVVRNPNTGAVTERTLRATVAYAPSCGAPIEQFRAGTLVVYTSYASGSPATTFTLLAASTPGDFGTSGEATTLPVDNTLPAVQGAGFLLNLTLSSLGFTPKYLSMSTQQLLSAAGDLGPTAATEGATSDPAGTTTRRQMLQDLQQQQHQQLQETASGGLTVEQKVRVATWAAQQGAALAAAKRRVFGSHQPRSRDTSHGHTQPQLGQRTGSSTTAGAARRHAQGVDSASAGFGDAGTADFIAQLQAKYGAGTSTGDWLAQQQATAQQQQQVFGGHAAGEGPAGEGVARSPSSLAQYFGADTLAEVATSEGGVIIPAYFLSYRLPGSSAQGGAVAYARTFQGAACFKWGYAANLSLVQDTLPAWSGGPGLRVDAARGWSARFTAVDVAGELLQFEQVTADGGKYTGSTQAVQVPPRTTDAGCTCKSQWFYNFTGGEVVGYTGCQAVSNWSRPGCEVVPGSCPNGASPPISSQYDYCAPLRTLAGCACQQQWAPSGSSSMLYGTCAPRDAAHPMASWCQVDSSSCPSSARAQGTSDTSWDYCAQRTQQGCECANTWVDAAGQVHSGQCAVSADPLAGGQLTAWCATSAAQGAFTAPPGMAAGSTSCPVAWDRCTPLLPRIATPSPGGNVSQCLLPRTNTGADGTAGLPLGTLLTSDCSPYDLSLLPGNTSVAPFCYIDPNVGLSPAPSPPLADVKATCVANTCAAPILAACPPVANTTASVEACFRQVCMARVRSGDFTAATCPSDSPSDLLLASTVYNNLYSAQTSSSNQSNPWITTYLSNTPMTTGEYCTKTYGYMCGSLLTHMCPGVTLTPQGGYTLVPQALTCNVVCLATAGYVLEKLNAGGGAPNTGCADAAMLQPTLQRLFAWYNAQCEVEPGNLSYKRFTAMQTDTSVCPTWLDPASSLTGPFGAFSSFLPTVGLFNEAGNLPLAAATLSSLAASTHAAAAAAVQTALAYPRMQYNASTTCIWQILPADPSASYIKITLQFLSTEFNYDALKVFTADQQQLSLSGPLDPQPVDPSLWVLAGNATSQQFLPGSGATLETASGGMFITFTSDDSLQGLGFSATYNTSSEPIKTVSTCTGDERLVSIFTSLYSAAGQASYAIVSPDAPCANPAASTLPSGNTSPVVYGTAGPAPTATMGPQSAAVGSAFPQGAPLLPQFTADVNYWCLRPGQYKVQRFDMRGGGAWAPGSLGAAVAEGPIKNMTDTMANGNGTQGSSPTKVYELCDVITVPPRPAGGTDTPAAWPVGPFGFSYTVDLLGLPGDYFTTSYARARLALAVATSTGTATTRSVNLLRNASLSGRRRSTLEASALRAGAHVDAHAPGSGPHTSVLSSAAPSLQAGDEMTGHGARMGHGGGASSLPQVHVDWERFMAQAAPSAAADAQETGVTVVSSSSPDGRDGHLMTGGSARQQLQHDAWVQQMVRRRLQAGSSGGGVQLQLQVGGYWDPKAASAGLDAFHQAVVGSKFVADLHSAGLTDVTAVVSHTTPPSAPTDSSSSKKLPMPAIIGIAVGLGCLALLLLLVIVVVKARSQPGKHNPQVAADPSGLAPTTYPVPAAVAAPAAYPGSPASPAAAYPGAHPSSPAPGPYTPGAAGTAAYSPAGSNIHSPGGNIHSPGGYGAYPGTYPPPAPGQQGHQALPMGGAAGYPGQPWPAPAGGLPQGYQQPPSMPGQGGPYAMPAGPYAPPNGAYQAPYPPTGNSAAYPANAGAAPYPAPPHAMYPTGVAGGAPPSPQLPGAFPPPAVGAGAYPAVQPAAHAQYPPSQPAPLSSLGGAPAVPGAVLPVGPSAPGHM